MEGHPGHAGADDVVEMAGRPALWPRLGPRQATAAVCGAALLAGLLVGYLAGHRGARTRAPAAATTTATPQVASPALTLTGNRCAVQHGTTLELGIEFMNQSPAAVTLLRYKPVLPMGGLRATAGVWGTCGALLPPGAVADPSLGPGATGWLTVSFDVQVQCPEPLPVQFRVSYRESGRVATAELDEFPDLTPIHYTGCPGAP
jgi:hypothetical protein